MALSRPFLKWSSRSFYLRSIAHLCKRNEKNKQKTSIFKFINGSLDHQNCRIDNMICCAPSLNIQINTYDSVFKGPVEKRIELKIEKRHRSLAQGVSSENQWKNTYLIDESSLKKLSWFSMSWKRICGFVLLFSPWYIGIFKDEKCLQVYDFTIDNNYINLSHLCDINT